MFSLRRNARKNFRIVAIGSASLAAATTPSLATPDAVYWDPAITKSAALAGGTGTLDPAISNLFNPLLPPSSNDVAPLAPDNGFIYADYPGTTLNPPDSIHEGSDITFANTGGTVTIANPTYVHSITLSANNYTLTGAALTLGSYCQSNGNYGQTVITSNGNHTISADIRLEGHTMDTSNYPVGTYFGSRVDVQSGILNVNNLIMRSPGPFLAYFDKTGAGTLNVTGTLFTQGTYITSVRVLDGVLHLHGTTNFGGTGWPAQNGAHNEPAQGCVTVASGATLTGNTTLSTFNSQSFTVNIFDLQAGAHLAPGDNLLAPAQQFGGVGTFILSAHSQSSTTAAATLAANSNLDLDIASDSSYDAFTIGQDGFGDLTVTIANGAKVNINDGAGSLTPGTYHIITSTNAGLGGLLTINNNGLTIGNAPSGYTYNFQNVTGGIDLLVGVAPVNATWATNVNGQWETAANWTGGVPNAPGATANFTGNTLANITSAAGITVGRIFISGATNYTISTAPITFNNTGGVGANMVLSSAGGTQTITNDLVTTAGTLHISITSGTLRLDGAVTGTAALTLSGGGVLFMSDNNTFTGPLTLDGATLAGSGTITAAVNAGATPHTIAPSASLAAGNRATLTLGALNTNSNTTLAFRLITPNTANGSDTIVVSQQGGLTFNGGTIQITANPTGQASLGFYKAFQYNVFFTGALSGLTLPAPANNVVYTFDTAHDSGFLDIHRGFLGDANDDGTVNFADFVALSNHYGQFGQGWAAADFNADGVSNFADFVILSNHYGQNIAGGSFTASPDELAAMNAFAAANGVPEPATLSILALGALAVLKRRKTALKRPGTA
jgi:hypothetical protein